ncbi:MAG: DUF4893 domain-containing protein [Rhizobiales bacterium]|nr:DUF4893 domain-containing protein [Hyphomicrobiales bacterium]
MRWLVIAALMLLGLAGPAHADGELDARLTATDKARLADYAATRAEAIAEAKQGGSSADIEVLEALMEKEPLTFRNGFDLTGKWKCRTIKLGGMLPLTIYDWFDCRITDDGSGWYLVKTTGSQRTSGRFYDDGDARLVYLGALHYSRDKPLDYGNDAERNQVAYVFRTGPEELRMEFPAPKFESRLDILELKR